MTQGQRQFILENISTFRSVFLAFLVPFFGAIAYLFVNLPKMSILEIIETLVAISICVLMLIYCYFRYNYFLEQIKEM